MSERLEIINRWRDDMLALFEREVRASGYAHHHQLGWVKQAMLEIIGRQGGERGWEQRKIDAFLFLSDFIDYRRAGLIMEQSVLEERSRLRLRNYMIAEYDERARQRNPPPPPVVERYVPYSLRQIAATGNKGHFEVWDEEAQAWVIVRYVQHR